MPPRKWISPIGWQAPGLLLALALLCTPVLARAQVEDVLWALGSDSTLYSNPNSVDQRSFEIDLDDDTLDVVGGRALTANPESEGTQFLAILTTEPIGGGLQMDALYAIERFHFPTGPSATKLCDTWIEGMPGQNRDRIDSLALLEEMGAPVLYGVSGASESDNPNALYSFGAPDDMCSLEFVKLLRNAVGGESGAPLETLTSFLRIAGMSPVLSQEVDPATETAFREQIVFMSATDQLALRGVTFQPGTSGAFLATGVDFDTLEQSVFELIVDGVNEPTLTPVIPGLPFQPSGIALLDTDPRRPYASSIFEDALYRLDLDAPGMVESIPLTLEEGTVILGVDALAADIGENAGSLLAVLEIEGRTDRELARVMAPGDCFAMTSCPATALGPVSRLADLTFGIPDPQDPQLQLVGVTVDDAAGGGFPQLLAISLEEPPQETLITDLGAGGNGEAIAWDPDQGAFLHASGRGEVNVMSDGWILEWIDPSAADTAVIIGGETPVFPEAMTQAPPTEELDFSLQLADQAGLLLLTRDVDPKNEIDFDSTADGLLNQPVVGIAYALPEPRAGALAALVALSALVRWRRSTLGA